MKSLIVSVFFVLALVFGFAQSGFARPEVNSQPVAINRVPNAPLGQEVSLLATLSEVQGEVQISPKKDAAFAPAKNGDTLEIGGQIKTGADGRLRLDLSSGTIVRIAPSSLFTFQSNEPAAQGGLVTKLSLEVGKLWIILNGGSLEVETKSGVAAVRGSYMSLSVDPETKVIRITCLEGNCSWPVAGLNLVSGQALSLVYDPITGQVTSVEQGLMTQAELDDWLQNNPQAREILPSAFATMTALPNTLPGQRGTVPTPIAYATGSFDQKRVFTVGMAQVTIPDKRPGKVRSSTLSAWQFPPAARQNLTYLTDGVQVQTEFPAPGSNLFCAPTAESAS